MSPRQRGLFAGVIATLFALLPGAAAHAVPWDGEVIELPNSSWEMSSDPAGPMEVELMPGNQYVDTFDGVAIPIVSLDDWVHYGELYADTASDVDLSTTAEGDTVLSGPVNHWRLDGTNLSAVIEMRIYAGADLYRSAVTYTNDGSEPVTIDLGYLTDFGTSTETYEAGGIRGYEDASDDVLPLPADENAASMDALNAAGARWATHGVSAAASAGLAWGNDGASHPAELGYLFQDTYRVEMNDVEIPAGGSVTTVMFIRWAPDFMLDQGWTQSSSFADNEAIADEITAQSAEYATFDGRLSRGLEGLNVINWAAPAASPTPSESPAASLASTGPSDGSANAAGFGVLAALFGAALLAVRRRSASR